MGGGRRGGDGGGGFKGGEKGGSVPIPRFYEGTFVRWGADYSLTRSRLTVIFYDKKSSKIREQYLDNENNARFIRPSRAIKILGNSMKIGTPIKLKVIGSKILELGIKGDAPKVDYYVFLEKETALVEGQPSFLVKLGIGKAEWYLMVENKAPLKPLKPVKPRTTLETDDLKPTPTTAMFNKLNQFKKGDIVEITYKTKDFRYTLVDIRPYVLKITGKLTDKKSYVSEKKKYEVVLIKNEQGTTYTFSVPHEDTRQKAGIWQTLALIPVGAEVQVTGRKLGGVLRLDSISKKRVFAITSEKKE